MSMIQRYKKPGGFIQLLKLVETSTELKQEKFLKIIEDESPAWAKALREKMLTLARVMKWKEEALTEVFTRLPEVTLAACYHILNADQWIGISKNFAHAKMRKLHDLIHEKVPNEGEKTAAVLSILDEVRKMILEGHIKLEAIDPELAFQKDIEEKLEADSAGHVTQLKDEHIEVELGNISNPEVLEKIKNEMLSLKKKIIVLNHENQSLRKEITEFKEKIERIKKLAA